MNSSIARALLPRSYRSPPFSFLHNLGLLPLVSPPLAMGMQQGISITARCSRSFHLHLSQSPFGEPLQHSGAYRPLPAGFGHYSDVVYAYFK